MNDYFDFLRESQAGEYDHLPFGFITLSKKGIVKYVNTAASRLLQVEKRHLTNNRFYPYVHADDLKKIKYNKQSRNLDFPKTADIRLICRHAVLLTRMSISYDPYFKSAYGPIQLSFCDISEIKPVAPEKRESDQDQTPDQKSDQKPDQKKAAVGVFSNNMARDFKTILKSIIANIDTVINETSGDQEIRKTLDETVAAAKRAGEMATQIFSLTHPSGYDASPVRVQEIVREVIHVYRDMESKNIIVIQVIDDECGPVMANPTHIYQIAMNLITNAIQSMVPEGGMLDIMVKQVVPAREVVKKTDLTAGPYCCLTVQDTGAGIDDSIQDKTLDPFFAPKKDTDGETGGLSFYVISDIVKNNGGDIWLTSEPGKGTRFDVYLPLAGDSKTRNTCTDKKKKPFSGDESILFIDDDPAIVKVQKRALEGYGYRVTTHTDTRDALVDFKSGAQTFDIVICDMTMPVLNGLKFARLVKDIQPDLPVIISTGFSPEINEDNYREMGVDGFLMKPASKDESLRLIRHILDQK